MSSAAMSLHRPHPSTFTVVRRAMLFVLFTHALAVATATATDGSGSAGAVYSVWEATDPCSAPMDLNGCRSSVDCNTCLTRPGCAIESTTAKCVSASRINASVGIEYFITGTANYCDASDDACTACGVTSKSNQAVCRGAHGCICVRQCEITPIEVIKCNSDNQANNMLYLVIACTVVAPLLVFVRLHRKFSGSLTRYLVPVRRPRQPKENPLALKLDGWRNHLEHEAKDQPTTIELKRCSLHSDSDNASSMEEGRHTEDCDAFSPMGSQSHIEDAYVVVTTPKASSAQPARGV